MLRRGRGASLRGPDRGIARVLGSRVARRCRPPPRHWRRRAPRL